MVGVLGLVTAVDAQSALDGVQHQEAEHEGQQR
jgi:hypothetical protein